MNDLAKALILSICFFGFSSTGFAYEKKSKIADNMVCVQNSSTENYVFSAEAGEGTRQVKSLLSGQKLCVTANEKSAKAIVSVFEKSDSMEGCTKIVKLGTTEEMFKYSHSDRCLWSSNK